MNIDKIKKFIFERKGCLIIVFASLAISATLYLEIENNKYFIFYQYKSIPDIYIGNTLYNTQDGWRGEIKGFVRFAHIEDQPKDIRQYYILRALDKYNEKSQQYFSLEDIVDTQYLPPQSIGTTYLLETSDVGTSVTLTDEHGNLFFIDKSTGGISMRDVTGEHSSLITSNLEYRDFMKELWDI